VIEGSVNRDAIEQLIANNALHHPEPALDVVAIAEAMERANARRLQPHYIASFFREAFALLGGKLKPREAGRYEISHVPGILRQRGRMIGRGAPLLERYERITFDRACRQMDGKPTASFVVPGHPLLDTVNDVVLERHRTLLKQGTILVDDTADSGKPRVLCMLEHEITDGRTNRKGDPMTVSKRLQFVEIDETGAMRDAGPAPYLDYRPPTDDEAAAIAPMLVQPWLVEDLEKVAVGHAVSTLAPKHLAEVQQRTERLIERSLSAVHERLTYEINYWDHRYVDLRDKEAAGKKTRLPSEQARNRRDDLQSRLEARTVELNLQRRLSARKPLVRGAMLVVPAAVLTTPAPDATDNLLATAEARRRVELVAMGAVMERERALGNHPEDVSACNVGYDIESRVPGAPPGRMRLIEVKGRVVGSPTVTVTRNEILTARNSPEHWILALVEVDGDSGDVTYLKEPFRNTPDPDFTVAGISFDIRRLLWASVMEIGC
jgi:hypothetical protein